MRRMMILLVVAMVGLSVWNPMAVHGAQRCFSETGFCIDGRIREFWEQNGGLAVFGYPIGALVSVQVDGKNISSQQFERNRMELHPENARPYDVQLGRLGAQYTQRTFDMQNLPSEGIAETDISGDYLAYRDDCRWFVETQHYICGDFYDYWHNHGLQFDSNPRYTDAERIALFGLPISSFRRQTINGQEFFVQLFERARFEYHPENPAPFKVQLGLLGREEAVIETPPPADVPAVSAVSNGVPTTPVILPESDLRAFRYKMPTPGYWMASADGMVASVGSFQYMRELKGYTAPKGQKFVVFAITIKNTRTEAYRGEYVNTAYFTITDLEGVARDRIVATYALEGIFQAAYLSPGQQSGGQIAFLIPSNSAPGQVHIDFSDNPITIELRTWPITQ